MSRVITFSRVFPSYHPRKGEPTYFVEQIIKGLPYSLHDDSAWGNIELCTKLVLAIDKWKDLGRKYHTIRAGHRFKVGDKFSPRVWSGKPYASKQIQFAPDIEVRKVYSFSIGLAAIYIDQQRWIDKVFIGKVAGNDGLELQDFLDWFQYPKPFDGQVICWNENINY